MTISKSIENNSYAVYGLGLSGNSTYKFLKKKNVKKIYTWDDKKNKNNKKKFDIFKEALDFVDFIVISPGINIYKTKLSLKLFQNKKKIITDLDLFYMQKIPVKSIVITGTNGKSTACKLIQYILKNDRLSFNILLKPLYTIRVVERNYLNTGIALW